MGLSQNQSSMGEWTTRLACQVSSIPVPCSVWLSVTSQFLKEADSETEICMPEDYWGAHLVSTLWWGGAVEMGQEGSLNCDWLQ